MIRFMVALVSLVVILLASARTVRADYRYDDDRAQRDIARRNDAIQRDIARQNAELERNVARRNAELERNIARSRYTSPGYTGGYRSSHYPPLRDERVRVEFGVSRDEECFGGVSWFFGFRVNTDRSYYDRYHHHHRP